MFKIGFQNRKRNYLNRKWNYLSHLWPSDEKTSYTRCCHTRLHLGFSANLRIWQVSACKMEPQRGIILMKPTQPPTLRPYGSSYCHTRHHLGFSAKLRIWQVPACKMEPKSGNIFCKNRPDRPTDPTDRPDRPTSQSSLRSCF